MLQPSDKRSAWNFSAAPSFFSITGVGYNDTIFTAHFKGYLPDLYLVENGYQWVGGCKQCGGFKYRL